MTKVNRRERGGRRRRGSDDACKVEATTDAEGDMNVTLQLLIRGKRSTNISANTIVSI